MKKNITFETIIKNNYYDEFLSFMKNLKTSSIRYFNSDGYHMILEIISDDPKDIDLVEQEINKWK